MGEEQTWLEQSRRGAGQTRSDRSVGRVQRKGVQRRQSSLENRSGIGGSRKWQIDGVSIKNSGRVDAVILCREGDCSAALVM